MPIEIIRQMHVGQQLASKQRALDILVNSGPLTPEEKSNILNQYLAEIKACANFEEALVVVKRTIEETCEYIATSGCPACNGGMFKIGTDGRPVGMGERLVAEWQDCPYCNK